MLKITELDSITLLALAKRMDTPQPILLALSRSEDKTLRREVAANKETDQAILSILAFDSDSVVRNNVASNPGTAEIVLRHLASDDCSSNQIESNDDWIKKAVAGNPSTPPDILDSFVRFKYRNGDRSSFAGGDGIAATASKNPEMPVAGLLRDVVKGANWAFEFIANNRSVSADVLWAISTLDEKDLVRAESNNEFLSLRIRRMLDNLASNPNTPTSLLEKKELNQAIVAANPGTPSNVLNDLPWHDAIGSNDVRKALAANPNTPPRVLSNMSNFIFSDVTNLVAANPSTDKKDLVRLSKKQDLSPYRDYDSTERKQYALNRINVAGNPSTPLNTLEELLAEGDPSIKLAIASNPSATNKMLNKLAKDEDADVKLAAYTNPRYNLLSSLDINPDNLQFFLEDTLPVSQAETDESLFSTAFQRIEALSALACRSDLPEFWANFILKKTDSMVRAIFATNSDITQREIALLSRDVSPLVRKKIAERNDIQSGVLKTLINDRNSDVRKAAKNNPNGIGLIAHNNFLEDLENERVLAGNPDTNMSVLREIFRNSSNNYTLSLIALNPSTPKDVLLQFAKQGKQIKSIAANESITGEIIEIILPQMKRDEKFILLGNPSAPRFFLEENADPKKTDSCQKAIASNPATASELLDIFAHEGSETLRVCVASNPSASQDTLNFLASDADPLVRGLVAENTSTDWETLKKLSNDVEEWVYIKAIKNPNKVSVAERIPSFIGPTLLDKLHIAINSGTNIEELLNLASDDNPVVRIAAMTNKRYPLATILERLIPFEANVRTASSMREESSLGSFFNSTNIEIKQAIAERIDIPFEIQKDLATDPDSGIRQKIAKNPYIDPTILESMAQNTSDQAVLVRLASNSSLPKSAMERLAVIEDGQIIDALTENSNLTAKSFSLILQNKCRPLFTGLQLARDADTDPELLVAAATVERCPYFILEAIASNPNTPTDTLLTLSKNGVPKIRAAVGENPSTPTTLLNELAEDESYEVRCGVAKNPQITRDLLVKLYTESANLIGATKECLLWIVNHGTSYARYRLASSSFVPEECLIELTNDNDSEVLRALLTNEKTPDNAKEKILQTVADLSSGSLYEERQKQERKENPYCRAENEPYFYLASNFNTPSNILGFLAHKMDWKVASALSCNPNTPLSVLEEILQEDTPTYSSTIAKRRNLSKRLLERLSKNKDHSVRLAVAENPETPFDIIKELVDDANVDVAMKAASHSVLQADYLFQIAQSPKYWLREAILENPNTSIETIEFLAQDSDETVRRKVAASNKTTSDTLSLLAMDQSGEVRAAVAASKNATPETLSILARDSLNEVRDRALKNPQFDLFSCLG